MSADRGGRMKTVRKIFEIAISKCETALDGNYEAQKKVIINQALLALREVVVPEEKKLKSHMPYIGYNDEVTGWNACRSELLHRLNGEG